MKEGTRNVKGRYRAAALLAAAVMTVGLGACAPKEQTSAGPVTQIACTEADAQYVNLYGRSYAYEEGTAFPNAASGFEVRFYGTTLTAQLSAFGQWDADLSVFVDGERDSNACVITVERGGFAEVAVAQLAEGEHTIRVLKRHDSLRNTLACGTLTTDGYFLEAPERPAIKIEAYGDSITNGSGILRETDAQAHTDSGEYTARTQNALQAYAAVAAQQLDAELRIYGRGGIAMAYSTDRNTVSSNYAAAAVDLDSTYFPYDYNSWTPDAVVIYLGTNDVLISAQHDTGFTFDGLRAAFINFLRTVIGPYYGRETPVFLCSGMMVHDSGLAECMQSVKTALAGEFPALETLEFDACAIGHPVVAENEAAGKMLARAIAEKISD